MKLYWKRRKKGLDLVLRTEADEEINMGGVRFTKKGYEAIAVTTGYDPGRATKGLASEEDAKNFVLQFEPWREFFPSANLTPEKEILEEA